MSENLDYIKKELRQLCQEFNLMLKRLEEQKLITHDEYLEYSSKKIEFLNN